MRDQFLLGHSSRVCDISCLCFLHRRIVLTDTCLHVVYELRSMRLLDTFSLCPKYSYFAQAIYLIDKTEKIPCQFKNDQVLFQNTQPSENSYSAQDHSRRYRFLLCEEYISLVTSSPFNPFTGGISFV